MPSNVRTGDQALVREINLSLIMNCLHTHTPISRARLAEMTGLNRSTVSSLVRELMERGFIKELGFANSGIGRPSQMLTLNPAAGYIISCEIGVDFISVIVTDFAPQILWRHLKSTQGYFSQKDVIDCTIQILNDAIEQGEKLCGQCPGLLGISLAVPGLVDETGTLLFAPNLRWEDVPLRRIVLEKFSHVQIFVDNEANLAALGEYFFGAAIGCAGLLYISVGVGLGGAIVVDGHIFKGKTGFASEFGHMTMLPDGELCNCGNRGCWETLVSQSALFRYIKERIEAGQKTLISELLDGNPGRLTVALIVEAADKGDPLAREALTHVGQWLGIGIASLVNAINPDLVLFGGILSHAARYFLPMIEAEIQRRSLKPNVKAAQVKVAKHGFEAGVMGGVAKVYHAILADPSVRPHLISE
jgi:glucokinase-like ROK family protein